MMSASTVVITILSILLVVSWVVIYNMLIKFETAEEEILNMEEALVRNKNIIQNTVDNMRIIDSKGGFESEDEVGSVFKALLTEIETLEQN